MNGRLKNNSLPKNIRVLFVIPYGLGKFNMLFSKRIAAYLKKKSDVKLENFFLLSRTSFFILIKEWIRFRKVINKFKPDLIDAQYGSMTAFFCAIGTRLPLIVTFRGNDLNPSKAEPLIKDLLAKFLSQISTLRARKIICVSKRLRGRLWWRRKDVKVISSGVDTNLFYPISQEEARLKLGWQKGERVVLFNASSGRNKIYKRLDLAQSAVDIAKDISGEIRFVVLDGCLDPKIIPTLMNGADCLLVTSDVEGSPNIVREALACNLPIISVDVGDVPERLRNVFPSQIVSRDPEKIGQALAEILEKRQRSNGAEFIKELSLENITDKILFNYREALRI